MNQLSHISAWFLQVPKRLFRGAWLFTLAVVVTVVISERAEFLFPVPFLVLLTAVVVSGALGGLLSGLISGLLMTATILYFWTQGAGPEALTGTLARAALGSVIAVAVGSYIGLLRERLLELISELEARQRALKRMNNELADQVAERTADLQQTSDRLRGSQDRLLRVARRWIETEEIERGNLARDLHNDIGQGLTALHLNLETSKGSVANNPRLQQFVATSKELINQVTNSVRQLSQRLRPSLLDDLGLIAAVREYVSAQFDAAGIEYELQHEGNDKLIDPNSSIIAYRLIQEAIENVIRHSDASRAQISIQVGNEMLVVHIKDNGKGFDASQASNESQHFGLTSMRERASMMAGSCKVRSEPKNGTDVEIMLPLFAEEVVA
jgi:signal transduction histidine kinase